MIQVTQSALNEIRNSIKRYENEIENPYIRLNMSIGWGGPQLKLALEESAGEKDQVIEVEGIKFLVQDNATAYFQNTKIDYLKGMFGSGEFKILTM